MYIYVHTRTHDSSMFILIHTLIDLVRIHPGAMLVAVVHVEYTA